MPSIKTNISPGLYYRKMGSGPTLALLHGFPESSDIWRKVWDNLARKYTLIIPDFPGSGESVLQHDTSIPAMAGCVAEILAHEGITKAVIAGHSMGGYIALAFAEQYPDKAAGVSLINSTAAADDEEKKKNRLKTIELIQKGGKSAFIKQMVYNLFAEGFKQSNPDLIEEQVTLAMETDERALINYLRAMMDRKDQRNWLKTTSIPIQWVAGIEDNIIYYKKILEQCAESGINFVTFYNNCGHMAMLEDPDKLIHDLDTFVDHCYEN